MYDLTFEVDQCCWCVLYRSYLISGINTWIVVIVSTIRWFVLCEVYSLCEYSMLIKYQMTEQFEPPQSYTSVCILYNLILTAQNS